MALKKNEFEVEVLEDGTVKVTSGKFDGSVHMSADRALLWLQEQLGGEAKIHRGHTHSHDHAHDHDHDHAHDHEHAGAKK